MDDHYSSHFFSHIARCPINIAHHLVKDDEVHNLLKLSAQFVAWPHFYTFAVYLLPPIFNCWINFWTRQEMLLTHDSNVGFDDVRNYAHRNSMSDDVLLLAQNLERLMLNSC